MTPEEQEHYLAGGDMPPRVLEELARMDEQAKARTGMRSEFATGAQAELPVLDYPMPFAEVKYESASAFENKPEDIWYPPPSGDKPHQQEG
jgi:hypothetical protein